jgi:hypothetical protein
LGGGLGEQQKQYLKHRHTSRGRSLMPARLKEKL